MSRGTRSGHIVQPILSPTSIPTAIEKLSAAHDYLASAARAQSTELGRGDLDDWGSRAKRVVVDIVAPCPELVSAREHNFVEVVNQCATLERLLDALAWANVNLRSYEVRVCHPTTSSGSKASHNDLVVADASTGAEGHFEVSDVLTGIQKELKDHASLRVFTKGQVAVPWPTARVFLVLSRELGERLQSPTRHGLRRGLFRYETREHPNRQRTCIFEILPGPTGATA